MNTDINKNDLENIGKRLRTLIEKKGMLKKDFASLAGITPQTLSKIINGKYTNLSPRLVEKFSQLLNTNINYILCKSDDPGDNFVGSDNWYKRNSQYFYISGVISYLESLNYTITELLIIGNLEFARDSKTLMFSTFASKRDLLDYGFVLEDSTKVDSYINYEITEDVLIEIIEEADTSHIELCWEIEFQGTHKRINEQEFLDIMYSFSLLTQNYFNATLHDFNKVNVELSDLGRVIQKKNPPTSFSSDEAEAELKLYRAIYGDNIPENLKKEE